jgi:ectoine hydroxylase-related dioxygenase (phytanoyl-CoA dioxygenase family)
VQEGAGELAVFPKSHRLPRVYMAGSGVAKVTDEDWSHFGQVIVPAWTRLIEENGLGREIYRPKAGDVLIWHENLMHAGLPRTDMEKSRRSIVGHYFAEGAIAYYDSSGLPGMTYEAA